MRNQPSKLGILGALALSACASVPAVQKPQNFPRVDKPEVIGASKDVAQAVSDVMMKEPAPVSCDQLLSGITEVADNLRWHSYSRSPNISEGEWQEKRFELNDGVTLILTQQTDPRYLDLKLIQACVRETASESDAAGFYLGRVCVDDK